MKHAVATLLLTGALTLTAAAQAASDEGAEGSGLERITYDLGASGGTYNGNSYSEVDLGVNLYLSRYLAWRNAGFGRFQTGVDNLYGLDTSMRAIADADLGSVGFTAFVGPGFRFVTKGDHVPFVEGGLLFKLGGLAIGGGVKQLAYSWLGGSRVNDTQTFFILAGGGSL
jgi:hypothetical protein